MDIVLALLYRVKWCLGSRREGVVLGERKRAPTTIYIDDEGGYLDQYIGHLYICSIDSMDSHRLIGVQFTLEINF